jgi:hypothetical protein
MRTEIETAGSDWDLPRDLQYSRWRSCWLSCSGNLRLQSPKTRDPQNSRPSELWKSSVDYLGTESPIRSDPRPMRGFGSGSWTNCAIWDIRPRSDRILSAVRHMYAEQSRIFWFALMERNPANQYC